jgi:CRP/FNR family transcriptional activator FtrB
MNALDTTTAALQPATARDALDAIPWLSGVSDATKRRLADQALLIQMPSGAQLFEQAETPAFAQFLLSGTIELLAVRGDEETLVELLRPVDLILPAAVLSHLPYLVRARVRDYATLLLIQADGFRRAVAEDHAICLAVLACQAVQFRRQMKMAKAIRLRSAEERVGSYLLALAEANNGWPKIRLPVEKRQIAAQLGMSRETFSRALPAVSRHGLRVSGDTLYAHDLAAARRAFPLDPLIDGPEAIAPLALGKTR